MSFKEQLKNEILPKTVEYYNSGIGINEAIVKAAEEFKLNLDQTDRLLETMNTARVIAHYEKNAEDRTANCDIADKDAVRKLLYADKPSEKTASAVSGSVWGDYASYGFGERNYRTSASLEKAASTEGENPEKSDFTIKQAADKVAKHARDIEAQRRFAEERVGMARSIVATSLSKIAASLSRGYEPERRFALFKAACSASCPNVVKSVTSEMRPQIVKDAEQHFKALRRMNVLDTASVDKEIDMAESVEEDLSKVAEMESKAAACLRYENRVKSVLNKYAKAIKLGANRGPTGGKDKDKDKDKDKNKDKSEKTDPWMPGAVVKNTFKSIKDNVTKPSPGTEALYKYLHGGALTPEKIDDAVFAPGPVKTGLKDYVNNLRRSSIISELYSDDPIISEVDPETVTRAYAMMVQASPEASLNKEVTRAFLRQAVNSIAVSPFDAKQLSDLDTALLKNKTLDAGKMA